MFEGKNIVVGICGGIAAYKACELVSFLRQDGAEVSCIMTRHATELVTPTTFGELSGRDVAVDMFGNIARWDVAHIALATRADVFVIAPATANMIGKIASGIADDMLSTTVMATKAPVILVPSMNTNMYENPIVQENLRKLAALGYLIVEPETGHLACHTTGKGRYPKTESILAALEKALYGKRLLKGKRVLVSAGGTKENIDPVRYIGNRSSGKMGYAIARAAAMEEADVTLVSCTHELSIPEGVKMIYAQDARDLQKEMDARYDEADIVIMAAAVSDYRPVTQATQKIKKEDNDSLEIHLTQNPDILYGLGQRKTNQFLVGFAAETNDVIAHGKAKLARKNLDMLVANDVSAEGAGFNVSTNIAAILHKDGKTEEFSIMSKEKLGHVIIEKIAEKM